MIKAFIYVSNLSNNSNAEALAIKEIMQKLLKMRKYAKRIEIEFKDGIEGPEPESIYANQAEQIFGPYLIEEIFQRANEMLTQKQINKYQKEEE